MRLSKAMAMLVMLITLPLFACNLTGDDDPVPTSPPQLVIVTPTPNTQVVNQTTPTQQSSAALTPTTNPATCRPIQSGYAYTVQSGDTLSDLAARTNTTVDGLVTANCLDNPDTLSVGDILYLPAQPAPRPTPSSNCANAWFFNFASGISPNDSFIGSNLTICPQAAVAVPAEGLDFQNGRVYVYNAAPGESDQRATIYVIYNDKSWETSIDVWDRVTAMPNLGLTAPSGLYIPLGRIGWMWHNNTDIRNKLGFAYESAPQSFTGRTQLLADPTGTLWNNRTFHFYLDHGKNIVLRLYSVDMAPNYWIVAGSY